MLFELLTDSTRNRHSLKFNQAEPNLSETLHFAPERGNVEILKCID